VIAAFDRLELPGRFLVGLIVATIAGVAIALVDSSQGWDDTGVTVFGLFLAAAVSAAIAGGRPWLITLLVGGFVPLVEIPRGGAGASLFALLFAAVGAGVGAVLGRVFEANR
jgi:hypothetical protein